MTAFSRVVTYQGARRKVANSSMFSGQSDLVLHDARTGRLTVDRLAMASMMIGHVESTGHDVDLSEQLGLSLVVPLRGALISQTRGETLEAHAGEALLFSPDRRRSRVVGSIGLPYKGLAFVLPFAEVVETAERLGVAGRRLREIGPFSLQLDPAVSPVASEIFGCARLIMGEIQRNSPRLSFAENQVSWCRLMAEKLVEHLAGADLIRLPDASRGDKAHRHVRVAMEFMRADYADIVGMADVAAACGISIRSLEYAFKSVWGVSPQAALTRIRLEEARRLLSTPGGVSTVTQAALACGFNHPGRFAAAYRSKFGETPSQTLARA